MSKKKPVIDRTKSIYHVAFCCPDGLRRSLLPDDYRPWHTTQPSAHAMAAALCLHLQELGITAQVGINRYTVPASRGTRSVGPLCKFLNQSIALDAALDRWTVGGDGIVKLEVSGRPTDDTD